MADSKLVWAPTTDTDDESFFWAPLGSTLPEDALDTLDSAFEGCGWMGEDGFRNNIERSTTPRRAFSGQVVKVTQDSYDETLTVTFYERKPVTLQVVFGTDNLIADYSSGHRKLTIRHDDKPLPRQCYVVRVVEGTKTELLVIPEGQVVSVEEVQIVHNELWQYTCEIYAYKPPNGTLPGNPAGVNEYTDEPDVTEPGT